MMKLYRKNEVLFAVLWIVAYCALTIPIRGELGDESPLMTAALAALAVGITLFVKMNHLEEKYGLARWPSNARRYLWFIPMWILATGNLWGGFSMAYSGLSQLCAVVSMLLIGYVEEMIFRGFLFKALIPKDGVKIAIIVSAVTFGIGHIVNLLAGQANLETVIQVFFAVAWGFIFTFVFYKSGSLWPCIVAHALVNAFSKFARESVMTTWVYMAATIVVAIVYCLWLSRLAPEDSAKA